MDDMYQYAASAVNSNSQTQPAAVAEEDDVILKAFNNFGWGKRWSNIVDTVKKQSEAFVEGTKKDLQEIAHVLQEDGSDDEEERAREAASTDALLSNLGQINTVNFASLRDGLTHTLNETLPSQITNVRLPENMDLAQLKEGLTNGTRSAEHYLQKFGADVISALKNTVTVLGPDEQTETPRKSEENAGPRIFASRRDALLAKMQTNDDTYLNEPELSKEDPEHDQKLLDTFNAGFKIDEYTEEIAQLLDKSPELRETMDRLVPIKVSYTLFWQRYFYHVWKMDQDEQKRQLIVKGVEEDEKDFSWDLSDDEDSSTTPTIKEPKEQDKNKLPTTNSDTDFSNISGPPSTEASVASPLLKSTEDEWVKAEKKKTDDEDSDSDWE
ncbi:hypothetical protein K501DRAFT_227937 [Backusella circina FSU 941]|nr:hypothetical protein K501DRAFT_227937 [Backusella circina FSU 941]